MKQKAYLLSLLFLFALTYSCKKDSANDIIDLQSAYKLKYITEYRESSPEDTDTIYYEFLGESFIIKTHNSISRYENHYSKNGNTFQYDAYSNGSKSHTGIYLLNNTGLVDSSRIIRANNTVNNTSKNLYNSKGQSIINMTDYVTYRNLYTRTWQDDNIKYMIHTFTSLTNPSLNRRDSIVMEYLNHENNSAYLSPIEKKLGTFTKNLLSKRFYFNEEKVLYQTWEFEYNFDAKGRVTQKVWSIYKQPEKTLDRRDVTTYVYD